MACSENHQSQLRVPAVPRSLPEPLPGGVMKPRPDCINAVVFPAAGIGTRGDGHQLVNRGDRPAVYLEISNRDPEDAAYYSDIDMRWNAPDARGRYTRKDGSPP